MKHFKQLRYEKDLEGKIIKHVLFTDERCVIHFINDEFCILKSTGYDYNYIEIDDSAFSFDLTESSIWRLKNYGFLPEHEYKEHLAKFEEIQRNKLERDERNLYERLKTKFS